MGLAQASGSDPTLVWFAPSKLGLHPATGTWLYLLTPSLGSGIKMARAMLPAKPVKSGTLTGDTNHTPGPGDFHPDNTFLDGNG